MADGKVKKNYKVEIKNGRLTLTMNEKRDGRQISASCEYPLYLQEYCAKESKVKMVRKTKAQTEKFLLQTLGYNA